MAEAVQLQPQRSTVEFGHTHTPEHQTRDRLADAAPVPTTLIDNALPRPTKKGPAVLCDTVVTSIVVVPGLWRFQKVIVDPLATIDRKLLDEWESNIKQRLCAVLGQTITTGTIVSEFMMAGRRDNALKPTVMVTSGDKSIIKRVLKVFKSQQMQWLRHSARDNGFQFVAAVHATALSTSIQPVGEQADSVHHIHGVLTISFICTAVTMGMLLCLAIALLPITYSPSTSSHPERLAESNALTRLWRRRPSESANVTVPDYVATASSDGISRNGAIIGGVVGGIGIILIIGVPLLVYLRFTRRQKVQSRQPDTTSEMRFQGMETVTPTLYGTTHHFPISGNMPMDRTSIREPVYGSDPRQPSLVPENLAPSTLNPSPVGLKPNPSPVALDPTISTSAVCESSTTLHNGRSSQHEISLRGINGRQPISSVNLKELVTPLRECMLKYDTGSTYCGRGLRLTGGLRKGYGSCTLGGLILVDGKAYALTAFHPFMQALTKLNPPTTDDTGDDGDSEELPFWYCSQDAQGDGSDDGPDITRTAFAHDEAVQPVSNHTSSTSKIIRSVSNTATESICTDWTLLPLASDQPILPNFLRDGSRHFITVVNEIAVGVTDGDVYVMCGDSARSGRLRGVTSTIQHDQSLYDVQMLLLTEPLRCSGSWVVSGNKLCGHIIAIRQNVPYAYMVPIEATLKDMTSKLKIGNITLP